MQSSLFKISKSVLVLLVMLLSISAKAQMKRSPVTTRILFIFDESNSMTAGWESGTKIEVAKKMLIKMVDKLKEYENVEMALRMYGHQSKVPPQDCSDTKLEVPFRKNNAEYIKQKLRYTTPKGTTPIARSLEEAGDDFPPCVNCRNIIILITDGIEACNGDPCKIALGLYEKGITLKPFIIGIGLDVKFKEAFECIGQFYNANDEEEFEQIVTTIIEKSVKGTTAEIDLLDAYNQPAETNVGISLYNSDRKIIDRQIIHTLNALGNPDTLSMSPDVNYSMTVHTIPPVHVSGIKLREGKHNKIKAKTPQGTLNVIQNDGLEYKGLQYIIRKNGSKETLHVGRMFEPQKYITGTYDLEILCLPRIKRYGIEIGQSQKQLVKIPQPGLANIFLPAKGYGGIYLISKGKTRLIKSLRMETQANVHLQPGHYIVIHRTKGARATMFTKERHFIIRSKQSINVNLR
ncbi:MAG: VWA domain-containing protein [Bacteroidota bacterium]|nr:VWA domain-containing protein [Bacteroidota bacterium]